MIDVNVHTGSWPFQRFPFDSLEALADHLAAEQISIGYVSHLGCVLYADPDVYNRELIEGCRNVEPLRPVPVINPHLNGWRQNLAAYLDEGVRAVKIIPSFHNFRLYSRPVFELIEALEDDGLRLMIQMRYEDERERYFALNVYGPKVDQVVKLANRFAGTEILCLNAYLPEAREFGKRTSNILVDIAFAEWLLTMNLMLEDLAPERVVFGSHSPLLVTRSAVMKLMESEISDKIKRQIASTNAKRFLGD